MVLFQALRKSIHALALRYTTRQKPGAGESSYKELERQGNVPTTTQENHAFVLPPEILG